MKNYALEIIMEGSGFGLIQTLSKYLLGKAEEYNEKPTSG
jgi:hypothetical protein